jgi:DNA invertase Pin-like site-specific DNA recombinase
VGARPVLAEALGFVREGDVFVVTKIDRLAPEVKVMAKAKKSPFPYGWTGETTSGY